MATNTIPTEIIMFLIVKIDNIGLLWSYVINQTSNVINTGEFNNTFAGGDKISLETCVVQYTIK